MAKSLSTGALNVNAGSKSSQSKCSPEGAAQRPSDIDTVATMSATNAWRREKRMVVCCSSKDDEFRFSTACEARGKMGSQGTPQKLREQHLRLSLEECKCSRERFSNLPQRQETDAEEFERVAFHRCKFGACQWGRWN